MIIVAAFVSTMANDTINELPLQLTRDNAVTMPFSLVFFAILIFGVIGNVLIIACTLKKGNLRSKSNVLIAILALCDFTSNIGALQVGRRSNVNADASAQHCFCAGVRGAVLVTVEHGAGALLFLPVALLICAQCWRNYDSDGGH